MPNLKISAMGAAATPLTGAELVPIVQGGLNKKALVSDLKTAPINLYNTNGSLGANRIVDLNGKNLEFSKSGIALFKITNASKTIDLLSGDETFANQNARALIDGATGALSLNGQGAGAVNFWEIQGSIAAINLDVTNAGRQQTFQLSPNTNISKLTNNGKNYIALDYGSNTYSFGDIGGAVNNTFFELDDTNKTLKLNTGGNNHFVIDMTANTLTFENGAGNRYIALNGLGTFEMGDIDNVANQTFLSINDTLQNVLISNNGNRYLRLDVANKVYELGDIDGATNSTKIVVDDTGKLVRLGTQAAFQVDIDTANKLVLVQDIAAVQVFMEINGGAGIKTCILGGVSGGNNTRILINDFNQFIELAQTAGLYITNVQTYINNADAVLAGRTAGYVYRLTGTDTLAVVH